MKSIYVASPLFSEAERKLNESICSILERHCEVFLPQRDGHLVGNLVASGMSARDAYATVFRKDIVALERSDAVLINLDGRSVDEGAAFELGFAFAHRKICVGFRTDVRVLIKWGLNPMVVVPLQTMISSLSELEHWAAQFARADASARVA